MVSDFTLFVSLHRLSLFGYFHSDLSLCSHGNGKFAGEIRQWYASRLYFRGFPLATFNCNGRRNEPRSSSVFGVMQ